MKKKFTLWFFLIVFLCAKSFAAKEFNEITLEDITNFQLTSDPINGSLNENNQLYSGTIIVYQTNEGRLGKFKVLSNSYNRVLVLRWVTYNSDGTEYSAGDSLAITPTWSCDLDLGLETNDGSDFFWRHSTEIIGELLPMNGALFGVYKIGSEISRYFADYVIGFSSQYSETNWSAAQVLGYPDIYPNAGDIPQAWASVNPGSEYEFLEMGYYNIGKATGVFVYETFNPGAVDSVFVRNYHTKEWVLMWNGQAGPVDDASRIFEVNFQQTDFLVDGVRITLNCSAVQGWNEIDAIGLELSNSQQLVQNYDINFFVNMTEAETDLGVVFDPHNHDVFITGDFAGWAMPGSDSAYKMKPDYDDLYSTSLQLEPGNYIYKYFLVPKTGGATWEFGEWTGDPSRELEVYNNVSVYDMFGSITVPDPPQVTFNLDMTDATEFNPEVDSVFITGGFFDWATPGTRTYDQLLERQGDSMLFSRTLTLAPGYYEYKYFINSGWDRGEWTGDPNRSIYFTQDTIINSNWGYLEGVPKHKIQVEIIPEGAGVIKGAGEYYAGNYIDLFAEPLGTNMFSHWEYADNEGNPVSSNTHYHFQMPNHNVYMRAMFLEIEFAGGSGTEQDPWQIATIGHLNSIRYFLGPHQTDKYFVQVADIDLNVAPYNQNEGWEPIGNGHWNGFFGNYDGNGYVIKNLFINRATNAYQGFFGWNSGTISNLGVIDAQVTDNGSRAGILAGINDFGSIENCFTSGLIQTNSIDGRIGGLVGWNNRLIQGCWSSADVLGAGQLIGGLVGSSTGNINDSYALGNVSGNERVGGLVGNLQGLASINNSFAAGNVSAQMQSAGGLIGISIGTGAISNSYATGTVTANNYAGGLIGYVGPTTVKNSYSAGLVRAARNMGGLIGTVIAETTDSILGCYWDTQTSGQAESAAGIGKTTLQMLQQAGFVGWNFSHIWAISEGVSYPYLFIQPDAQEHNLPVPAYTVNFQIMDPDEVLLDSAVMTFDNITYTAGLYSFIHHTGTYEWEVFLQGFYPESGQVSISDDNVSVTVIMDPIETGFVVDINDNTYTTIIIGEQEWMAENLRVTRYSNGDEISDGTGIGNILADQGYFFSYDDNPDYADVYGYLYSDYVVEDPRGLCPAGWTVPTNDQWKVMEMQLGMSWGETNNFGVLNGNDEGGKLKAKGTDVWHLPNVGATDELGFAALPGGYRYSLFSQVGSDAFFMTSTFVNNAPKIRRLTFNSDKLVHSAFGVKGAATSIRCIRIQPGQSVPEVVTGALLTVQATNVTIQGQVLNAGNATVVAKGFVYGTNPQPVVDNQQGFLFTDNGPGTGAFSNQFTGLIPGTTYYARAYAVNANGISYGEQVNFTTPQASLPSISSVQIMDVEQTSAKVASSISQWAGGDILEYGFLWAKTQNPTIYDEKVVAYPDNGEFSAEITGLQPNRIYFVRAYAIIGNDIRYSLTRNFFTQPEKAAPTIVTIGVENITAGSALVLAEVTDAGDAPVLARGLRVTLDNQHHEFVKGSGVGTFSYELTDLVSNKEYIVTAFAINEYGKKYGNALRFNTLFETAAEAGDYLNDIYRLMYAFNPNGIGGTGHDNFGVKSFDLTNDLMGEDMVVHSLGRGWFINHYKYTAHKDKNAALPKYTWLRYYEKINRLNILLQHLDQVSGNQAEKDRVKGQALALRAYSHFQLVQVFAPAFASDPDAMAIPYRLFGQKDYSKSLVREVKEEKEMQEMVYAWESRNKTTTEEKTADKSTGSGILHRATVAEFFNYLQSDLDEAITLLSGSGAQTHRSHIDISVAHGLRARVALAMEDWESAATQAEQAINTAQSNGKTLFSPETYNTGSFNTVNGSEWMWGSEINTGNATGYASFFSHMDARFQSYAHLDQQKKITAELYYAFPQTDVRRNLFVAPGEGVHPLVDYNQMKLLTKQQGSWAADYLYMRLSEMYLIRAEALAKGAGTAAQAQQTLYGLISQRDESYTQSVNSGQALVDEILLHRRMELWGEGFGVLDIKRLQKPLNRPAGEGNHNVNLADVLDITAKSDMFVWEIPFHYYLDVEVSGNGIVYMGEENYLTPALVFEGSLVKLQAEPFEGYAFVNWISDGQILGDKPTLEITMPSENLALIAHFEPAELVTYMVTATATPQEGGEVTGAGEFEVGEMVTLTATPAEGYEFVNWTEDGQEVEGAGQIYVFEVYANRNLVGNFQLKSYTIMATASPASGGRINGVQQLVGVWKYGEEVTLTATANTGFVFAGWMEGNTPLDEGATYTFTATTNRSLVAKFETDLITINAAANPTEGGVVFGAGVYIHGEPVTLMALAAPGFAFDNWSGNGTIIDGADAVYGFIAEESRDVVANFSKQNYFIDLMTNPVQGGQLSGEGYYAYGQSVTVTAVPHDGYRFVSWKAGNTIVSTDAEYNFTVTSNRILVASFALKHHLVSINSLPANNLGGSAIGGGTFAHGTQVSVVASPNLGYVFAGWSLEGESDILEEESLYSFTVTSPLNLMAHFDGNTYDISTHSDLLTGAVAGAGTYFFGDVVALQAQPEPGYYFLRWMENGNQVSVQNPYLFSAYNNRSLTAEFAEIWWDDGKQDKDTRVLITASVQPELLGLVWNQGKYEPGTEVTLIASPNAGVTFLGWLDEDENMIMDGDIPVGAEYTFVASEDLHLIALLDGGEKLAVAATAKPTQGGMVSVSGDGSFYPGQLAELSVQANAGYEFVKWTLEDETQVSVNPNYSFTVTEDRNLLAHFRAKETYELQLVANPVDAGTLKGAGNHIEGVTVDVSAIAEKGFTFQHWELGTDIFSTDSHTQVVMTGNITLEAYFEKNSYLITATSDAAEMGAVTGGGSYDHGSQVSLNAVPASGYYFVHWTEDNDILMDNDTPVGKDYSFTATQSRNLLAHFANITYTITAAAYPETAGSIQGAGTYNHLESVTLVAEPAAGYEFDKWMEGNADLAGAGATYTFNATVNRELTAHFSLKDYALEALVNPAEAGSVTGTGTMNMGATFTLTATANEGWVFENWTYLDGEDIVVVLDEDENPVGNVLEGTMPAADLTYTANFSETPATTYELSLLAQPAGAGTLTGEGEYEEDEEVTVTATAASNYVFINWMDAQENVLSDQASYTFYMPDNDLTLIAVFDIVDNVEEHLTAVIRLFPNPVRESLTVSSDHLIHRIIITDISGKLVYERSGIDSKECHISVAAFESGIYFVRTLGIHGQQVDRVQVVR